MAWWSLYKWFGEFRTAPFDDMIAWYRGKLYQDWYGSLSEEEKTEYQKKKEEQEKRNNDALGELMKTYAMLAAKMNNSPFLKGLM